MLTPLPRLAPTIGSPGIDPVGNSGTLLKRGWGEEIDNHAAVVRINNAPIKKFAADVGTRTTFRCPLSASSLDQTTPPQPGERALGEGAVCVEAHFRRLRLTNLPRCLQFGEPALGEGAGGSAGGAASQGGEGARLRERALLRAP
eukprot:416878-Prorocentrum_minimum.AAC.1